MYSSTTVNQAPNFGWREGIVETVGHSGDLVRNGLILQCQMDLVNINRENAVMMWPT